MPSVAHSMQTFRLLVANTLIATVTNNFIWFALTFWVYLETRSVMATAIIGGGYMLLFAISGMFFGTFVDRHPRKTSMMLSSGLSLGRSRSAASCSWWHPTDRHRISATPRSGPWSCWCWPERSPAISAPSRSRPA